MRDVRPGFFNYGIRQPGDSTRYQGEAMLSRLPPPPGHNPRVVVRGQRPDSDPLYSDPTYSDPNGTGDVPRGLARGYLVLIPLPARETFPPT